MRRSRSPHVSHVTRADDEGNGPPEFMCHMWMHERPPPCGCMVLASSYLVIAIANLRHLTVHLQYNIYKSLNGIMLLHYPPASSECRASGTGQRVPCSKATRNDRGPRANERRANERRANEQTCKRENEQTDRQPPAGICRGLWPPGM